MVAGVLHTNSERPRDRVTRINEEARPIGLRRPKRHKAKNTTARWGATNPFRVDARYDTSAARIAYPSLIIRPCRVIRIDRITTKWKTCGQAQNGKPVRHLRAKSVKRRNGVVGSTAKRQIWKYVRANVNGEGKAISFQKRQCCKFVIW